MPDQKTMARVRKDRREGKSASTQAGEFVREEIEHIGEGKHGARSAKQAIAIGLSKARRAGVAAKPSKMASKATKKKAAQDIAASKRRASGTVAKKAAAKKAARPRTRKAS
ncbi:MAG: hypothetical protein GAK28_03035 [Luteibacter sp.]|nr:MAG: hypothetical protein GAK28_03035 [Luteibacter sp.]